MKYPFVKPVMPQFSELSPHFKKIWESNYYSNFGPYTKELEKMVADYYNIDSGRVVTCSNATIGLMLAIKTLNWKDEILLPSYTFPATVQAIQWNNLKYTYADINPNTHHILLDETTPKCKNLLHVFPYGCPRFIEHGSFDSVIVDAASSLGNRNSEMLYAIANAGAVVFSLHATKVMGVGEGGIVILKSKALADRFRQLSNFGYQPNKDFINGGLNGKMCEVMAAIGVEKIKNIDKIINDIKKVAKMYKYYLRDYESVMHDVSYYDHPWQFVPLLVDNRDNILKSLKSRASIEAGKYYQPLHHSTSEPNCSLPITDEIAARTLSLPLYHNMKEEDVKYICGALKS